MPLDDRKLTATEERLSAMALPEVGCTAKAREAALARVRKMGLPGRRDEYWKWTRPDTLVQPDAPHAALFDAGEEPLFGKRDRLKIVFVDGVFSPELSDELSLEGIQVECRVGFRGELGQFICLHMQIGVVHLLGFFLVAE